VERLLPYYETELGYLRRHLRDFAERYPKIAGRLLLSGDTCADPHVEHMIESFALLNARIAKRLDDDYPQFTSALFDVLYPHYLRPFPSCSIAQFDVGAAAGQQSGVATIARGTRLTTRPTQGVTCVFRTVYPVTVAPLALSGAAFAAVIRAPEAVRLPDGATSCLSLTIDCTAEPGDLARQAPPRLRLFIDGESSLCAALRDALFMRTVAAYAEARHDGRWVRLGAIPIHAAGLADDEALIDFPARSHAAYRLLAEYFCYPDKFSFFDLDLAALAAAVAPGTRTVTLHLALSGIRSDSHAARTLEMLTSNNVLLGCTPVINLFHVRGEPIRLTHTSASYPVLADSRRAYGYEVQAIDSVHLIKQTSRGETTVRFEPLYSLKHAQTPEQYGHYWVLRRDETLAEKSPGFETQIAIVDIDFDPAEVETSTLNLELTCSNRDLPATLPYGRPGGDLFLEGGSNARTISLLRKPSPTYRFESGRGTQWRLISHLSLNHLSITAGGIDAFREMLVLYDLPRLPATQRQIGGIVAMDTRPASAWLPGNPFTCLVRGVQVRIGIDEEAFVGTGIHAFAQVVERFLGLYVHANSFAQLVIVSHKTGEELLTCLPRNGDVNLL
jgi:type VI secretion system protein ImpG